jgi:cathepsin L
MKLIGLLAVLAVTQALPVIDEFTKSQFETFKIDYSKKYATVEEEQKRLAIFADNLAYINELNKQYEAGKITFAAAVNHFADLSNDEFVQMYNKYKRPDGAVSNATTYLSPDGVTIPESVDWRTKGYVTPVKDQGQCGSCWSFSATGSLEGQWFKKTQKLVSLSEQNLVDCSGPEGNEGCNGGWMDQAFEYIKKNDGIDTEKSYPYEARDGKCRFKKENVGAHCTGKVDIPENNEAKLTEALATVGPISVAIDAGHRSFQVYSHGLYTEPRCSQTRLDHGVLAVGYGVTKDGQKYYIVKNSWSTTWGDDGYILMPRDHNNMCGIATAASYPLV